MFKYIDNKTERSVEATIKTLATKNDLNMGILLMKDDLNKGMLMMKDDLNTAIAGVKAELSDFRKEVADGKTETIKWMFVFWISQVAATLGIIM